MAKKKIAWADVDPDDPYLSIYCSGRPDRSGIPSHADRVWRLATFFLDEEAPPWPDGRLRWREVLHQYWTATGSVITTNTAPTRIALVGDRVVSQTEWRSNPSVFDQGSRSKYALPCKRCGLSLTVRDDKLNRALDELLPIGVREVPLLALAARVSKRVTGTALSGDTDRRRR